MRAKFFWAALLLVALLGIATAASASTRGPATGKQAAPHSINARDVAAQQAMEGAVGSSRFAAVVHRLGQLPVLGGLGPIDCTSSHHCIVLGGYGSRQPFVLSGDPAKWSATKARKITLGSSFGSGGVFASLVCASSTSCVAVGEDGNGQPLVLRGNPAKWSAANARTIRLGSSFGSRGWLSSIACVSSTSCVAVGQDGNGQPLLLAGDPATWTAANAKEITLGSDFYSNGWYGEFKSIVCTSSTWCVAVGGDGRSQSLVLTGDPATWNGSQVREIAAGGGGLSSIACTSSSRCVAVGQYGYVQPLLLVGDPATWTAANAKVIDLSEGPYGPTGSLSSIACTSSSRCVAVGQAELMDGMALLVLAGDPATWSAADAEEIPLGNGEDRYWRHVGLSSVACTSRTSCVATGGNEHYRPLVLTGNPARWSAEYANIKEITLTGPKFGVVASGTTLTCVSSRSCFDFGRYNMYGERRDWTLDDAGDVHWVDSHYPYLLRGSPMNWDHARATPVAGTGYGIGSALSITCLSARHCVAVENGGSRPLVQVGNPSSWGAKAPKQITLGERFGSGGGLRSVTCASRTRCVAVGQDWNGQPLVLTGDPAKWSAANAKEITLGERFHSSGDLKSVTCTSRTHCVAVGADGNGQPLVLVGNPSSWKAKNAKQITLGKRLGRGGSLSSVACPSSGYCVSVGRGRAAAKPLVLAGNPATWSAKSAFVLRVSAAKRTTVKGFSTILGFSDAVATGLTSISCRSGTYCVAVGGDTHAAPLYITGDPRKWKGKLLARPAKHGASFTTAALTSTACTRKTCFAGGFSNGGDFVATLKPR